MGWFSDLLSDAAAAPALDYTVHPIPSAMPDSEICVDRHYLRIWLRSARIVNMRRWTSKFHPAVHARFSYTDHAEGTREVASTAAPASSFEALDAENLDRFITINRPLLGPIPYRGQITMEVGLFSVKAADLAKPYLDLLLSLSETAGVSVLTAVQPFAGPIRKGAEILFKDKNYSELEIGLDKTETDLSAGNIIVARVPKGQVSFADLRLDPKDWKLTDANGEPVTTFPYMVLGIEKVLQRDDYSRIKDIREGWDAIRTAARDRRPAGEIEEHFAELRRIIWLSPDLLDDDKQRVLAKFQSDLEQAGVLQAPGQLVKRFGNESTDGGGALRAMDEIFGEMAAA